METATIAGGGGGGCGGGGGGGGGDRGGDDDGDGDGDADDNPKPKLQVPPVSSISSCAPTYHKSGTNLRAAWRHRFLNDPSAPQGCGTC